MDILHSSDSAHSPLAETNSFAELCFQSGQDESGNLLNFHKFSKNLNEIQVSSLSTKLMYIKGNSPKKSPK